MKKLSYIILVVLSFWIINCSAADGGRERHITIEKKGDNIMLGILMSELTDKDKDKLKIPGGAKIIDVVEGSSAEKAGLKKGDVVVNFDGQKIETAHQLNDLAEAIDEERDVKLSVVRDGKEINFTVPLKKMENKNYSYSFGGDDDFDWFEGDDGNVVWSSDDDDNKIIIKKFPGHSLRFLGENSGKGGFLGIEAHNISDQMLDYFEVKYGVLIEKVLDDSPAEKAGLKAGDVIISIEGRKIEDYSDLIRTLNYYNPKEKIAVKYMRKGSEKNTKVVLGEKKNSNMFLGKDGDKTIIDERAHIFPFKMKERFFNGDEKHIFYII